MPNESLENFLDIVLSVPGLGRGLTLISTSGVISSGKVVDTFALLNTKKFTLLYCDLLITPSSSVTDMNECVTDLNNIIPTVVLEGTNLLEMMPNESGTTILFPPSVLSFLQHSELAIDASTQQRGLFKFRFPIYARIKNGGKLELGLTTKINLVNTWRFITTIHTLVT